MLVFDEITEVRELSSLTKAARQDHLDRIARFKSRLKACIQSPMKHEPTVLVVEDDALLLSSVKRVLRKELEGFTVLTGVAKDAQEVIKQTPLDCLVVDLKLNGITGMDLCELLRYRSRSPLAPIIIWTGHVDLAEAKQAAIRCGANKVLLKEVDSVYSLVKLVRECIQMYRKYEEHQDEKDPNP